MISSFGFARVKVELQQLGGRAGIAKRTVRIAQSHAASIAASLQGVTGFLRQVNAGARQRAQERHDRNVRTGAMELVVDEPEIKLGVVPHQGAALQQSRHGRRNLRERRRISDVGLGDAVNVCRTNRTLRVHARGPLLKVKALRISLHNDDFHNTVAVNEQAGGLNIFNREARPHIRQIRHRLLTGNVQANALHQLVNLSPAVLVEI